MYLETRPTSTTRMGCANRTKPKLCAEILSEHKSIFKLLVYDEFIADRKLRPSVLGGVTRSRCLSFEVSNKEREVGERLILPLSASIHRNYALTLFEDIIAFASDGTLPSIPSAINIITYGRLSGCRMHSRADCDIIRQKLTVIFSLDGRLCSFALFARSFIRSCNL